MRRPAQLPSSRPPGAAQLASGPAAALPETGEDAGAQSAATERSPLLFAFVMSLFIPGIFPIGPIYLSFYKAILLCTIVPLGWRWIRGKAGPVTPTDILFLLFCLWLALSILVNHGAGRIVFIGTAFIEYFGAYLIGRVVISGERRFKETFQYILIALALMLPFALIETITGQTVLKDLVGSVLEVDGHNRSQRLGLWRVALGFPGPIQFGLVCSLFFANVYYIYGDYFTKRFAYSGLVLFMAFSALSSGPFFSLLLQGLMIGWDRVLGFIKGSWVILVLLGLFTYAVLELSLPNGLVRYIVDEVIFNPTGGQNRIAIFQYGTAEILRNPVFGIGLHDWIRPYWMNPTVDNFWIVISMRYGLPAMALLLLAIAASASQIAGATGLSEDAARYRSGYLIGLAGLTLVLATVHIWNPTAAMVMMYFGAGAWFYRPAADDRTGGRASDRVRRRQVAATRSRPSRNTPEAVRAAPSTAGGRRRP